MQDSLQAARAIARIPLSHIRQDTREAAWLRGKDAGPFARPLARSTLV